MINYHCLKKRNSMQQRTQISVDIWFWTTIDASWSIACIKHVLFGSKFWNFFVGWALYFQISLYISMSIWIKSTCRDLPRGEQRYNNAAMDNTVDKWHKNSVYCTHGTSNLRWFRVKFNKYLAQKCFIIYTHFRAKNDIYIVRIYIISW